MSDELFYTSVPRGLRPGASGFCTVAATAGLGPAWVARLEAISGYKPRYPVGDPREGDNPVAHSHVRLSVAGQTRSVLTRAAAAGADHTGRSNVFVHHVLPSDRERGTAGPAWAMRQLGLMDEAWDGGEPRTLAAGRPLPSGRPAPTPASAWQRETGEAAWAAALAGPAVVDAGSVVYVVYAPGTDVLALFDEAIRLMPEPQRWLVTFNTYFTEAPAAGTACAWRGVMAGTPAAALARGTVIDLTNLDPSSIPTGPLAEQARTGQPAAMTARPSLLDDLDAPVPGVTLASQPAAGSRGVPPSVRVRDLPTVVPPLAGRGPVKIPSTFEGGGRAAAKWPLVVGILAVGLATTAAAVGIALLRQRGDMAQAGGPSMSAPAAPTRGELDETKTTSPNAAPDVAVQVKTLGDVTTLITEAPTTRSRTRAKLPDVPPEVVIEAFSRLVSFAKTRAIATSAAWPGWVQRVRLAQKDGVQTANQKGVETAAPASTRPVTEAQPATAPAPTPVLELMTTSRAAGARKYKWDITTTPILRFNKATKLKLTKVKVRATHDFDLGSSSETPVTFTLHEGDIKQDKFKIGDLQFVVLASKDRVTSSFALKFADRFHAMERQIESDGKEAVSAISAKLPEDGKEREERLRRIFDAKTAAEVRLAALRQDREQIQAAYISNVQGCELKVVDEGASLVLEMEISGAGNGSAGGGPR